MNYKLLFGLFLILTNTLFSQKSEQHYFQGFTDEVSGKRFGYHSPFPDVNTSLLLRGQADFKPIEWMSEIVPINYAEEFVTFIWVFGRDVTANPVKFHLYVNDQQWFTFENSKLSTLGLSEISGKDGSKLSFDITMLDKYEDQMGFVLLKLPIKAIKLGLPTLLKVEAEAADNDAWFMTYKTGVDEKIDIYQNKVVVKKSGKLFHSISVDFIHVGEVTPASIRIGESSFKTTLKAGYNKLEINLPKVETNTEFVAEIIIGARAAIQKTFILSSIREWEIFLVQHTHSDVGYTRPQTEILPAHLQYIDRALDYCDLTDAYPDAAKFRWTCETSWSVREYLTSRPKEQVDRLLKRIREGRIEATGMFLNYSELIDESALAEQTKTLRMLKNYGIDVTTAMQNDVNGIAWSMIDYFHNTNIKYLTMGVHAHRARLPFDKPTAFWWQSPTGNKLLAFRSEHYQHGNSLSLTTGQEDVFRANLSNYLTGLEEREYPFDKISLQFSGFVTDNSPPSTKVCDIIRAWNEKYEWPKLRSALAKDFMIYLDKYHSNDIRQYKVAWPDWWTDGVGSAANESKTTRATQVEMASNKTLLSMAKILGAELPKTISTEVTDIYDDILFYTEHTMGAAESVSDPLAQNSVNQWSMKSAYIWSAAQKSSMLQEKALAIIEPYIDKSQLPSIAVFNTLNWHRSEMVELFIEHELIPEGVDFTITDYAENVIPVQTFERRMEGAYYGIWVENIPALGYKTLQIHVGKKSSLKVVNSSKELENQFYQINFDPDKGIVTLIFDKELGKNIIDQKDTLTFGQVIYEQLNNRHDLERLTNSTRDTIYKPLDLKRSVLKNIKISEVKNGPIYKSVFVHGDLPICADIRGVNIEIRLYHYQKKIEFLYKMVKLPVYSPEGVYVAFPFDLTDGKIDFETHGGIVYPGKNQLAGTSADWNTIQNYASVKSKDAQIVFESKDIPLVHFGDINIGRYYNLLNPQTNHFFSWVLNNYWVTNFKASQQGELNWSYSITSTKDNSDIFATRFGWGSRVPIISRVIMPMKGIEKFGFALKSLLSLDIPNVLLVNASLSADGKGIILHLREIAGDNIMLDINKLKLESGAISVHEINILEEELATLADSVLIEPNEIKFIKLNYGR